MSEHLRAAFIADIERAIFVNWEQMKARCTPEMAIIVWGQPGCFEMDIRSRDEIRNALVSSIGSEPAFLAPLASPDPSELVTVVYSKTLDANNTVAGTLVFRKPVTPEKGAQA